MHSILVSSKKLNELKMLADWQLREMGINPESVTEAVLRMQGNKA